jgi:hypothetical protein
VVAARWPAARGELRGLMARLDGGEGVRLDGVADKDLSRLLHDLFHNLGLKNRSGVYSLPKGAVPLLSTMAPVLAEAPDASLADTDIDVLLGVAEPAAEKPAVVATQAETAVAVGVTAASGVAAPDVDADADDADVEWVMAAEAEAIGEQRVDGGQQAEMANETRVDGVASASEVAQLQPAPPAEDIGPAPRKMVGVLLARGVVFLFRAQRAACLDFAVCDPSKGYSTRLKKPYGLPC